MTKKNTGISAVSNNAPVDKTFYGPLEVVKIEDLNSKTYLGNPRVKITFSDGTFRELPKNVFEQTKLKEPETDLTKFRDIRTVKTLEQIQSLFAENEVAKEDMEYIINRLPQLFNVLLTQSIEKKFGKPLFMVNLNDIDKILLGRE